MNAVLAQPVAETAEPVPTTGGVRRVLQRTILPVDRDLDVLPLYVDADQVVLGGVRDDDGAPEAETVESAPSPAQRPENILGRDRLRVDEGSRVSFGTYFNAFAASYWRMWTVVKSVELHVRVSGPATVIVYRSTADGRSQRVASADTSDQPDGDFTFELTLQPFGDGGWYWFDVVAGRKPAVMEEATWAAYVPESHTAVGTVTIGITTMNRVDFCLKLLEQLCDEAVLSVLDEVVVVDQGSARIVEGELYPQVERQLAGRLRVLEQGNIGGSGGFARTQLETMQAGRSRYVLLLDDDIVCEPESVLRAVTFADLCRTPTIVGGHMFSLYARSRLHAFGEGVEKWRFWWGPIGKVRPEHDFATRNLRSTRALHRRLDVDYNGWFSCLIPVEVLAEIGLSMPFFIKWDDAEYGLRAADAGYPTVSMPGVAVWHVPWTDKNDALDWQAYFHQRNRTITALLHSPYPRGGRIVRESFNHQVKHLLAMQYSVAELRLTALEDVLAGPYQLHGDILTKLTQVRSARAGFDDAATSADPAAFPAVKRSKPPKRGRQPTEPRGNVGQLVTAAKGAIRQALPVRNLARRHPEARLPAMDARWWMLAQFDSAVVSTSDGTSASWYRRRPERFNDLLRRSIVIHQRLYREWDELAKTYRHALPDVSSQQAWEKTFETAKPQT